MDMGEGLDKREQTTTMTRRQEKLTTYEATETLFPTSTDKIIDSGAELEAFWPDLDCERNSRG